MAYDNTWIEHFIDPEFITLYGERIICGSRSYQEKLFVVLEFNKSDYKS
jgi:hypothetical protein